ncbi:unnamed protein product [Schistosoma guineensis]|nr:unnamed protein product [Schistosoma guineensis]
MCTRNYINFQFYSSSVETCDSNSSNEEVTKLEQDYTSEYSYPCRWDQLPSNKHIFASYNFPSKLIYKNLQPEYWWSRYSTSLKDKCLKNRWLSYIGQCDERYNITEYQLIREIIWVLLGARGSFVMQLCENQMVDICCKPHLVSVSHLSYNALDSLLGKFVDWNNHILFIRLVVHFVVNKMDCVSHACAFSFASCLNGFLSQLDEFLHEMESKSRNPGIFTMISLYHCLIPWCNRVKILSKIIKDVIKNDLDNLRETSTITTLLDALHHTSDLLEDCGFDQYIVKVLRSMFIITFHPFISSLVQLFSGSAAFTDPMVKLFADINFNIPPNDPKFWSDAIKPRNNVLGSSHVPYMFLPIMDEVVDGLKTIFLLTAVCEKIGDYSFLETVDSNSICIFLDSLLSEHFRLKLNHQESCISKNCYKMDESRTTLKSLESQLKRFVCERRMSVNQQLLKLLLLSHMRGPNGLRTVGNCLAVAGAVYLFGAGDNMNDFARQCFRNIAFSRAKKLDLVELTANLQSQLSGAFRNRHVSHSLLYLESPFFTFDLLNMDQPVDDRPMELTFDLIGNLRLNYHLDWPANIILNENSIGIYNDVFIFLLQIEIKSNAKRKDKKANLDIEMNTDGVETPQDKCIFQVKTKSRNSNNSMVYLEDALRLGWTSQRASYLFDLLTRPPLLFSPSMGISLSFEKGSQNNYQILPANKRNRPIDPDPCLLSIDGLLDCLFVTNSLVDQIYHDCMDNPENRGTDEYEHSPTVLAAKFFRRRVKPIITRLSEFRLKLSDFKLGACVGRGACGIVRVVREVSPPHSVYAMKSQFKGAWLHHDPEGSQILLERTVLAQATAIENPWLPHLHYAFQDEKHLHLVMDYEPGGDLYIFLSKVGHLLDSKMIQFYCAEAVEAVHSLHQMGYIHCDLKPENFAIERSGHLKLIDFGSAIRLDADGKCVCPTMVGTKEYLNIELLRQRGRHNQEPLLVGPEFDYWAIGVLLYELFYGQTPFYDEDDDAMMQKIMDYRKTLKFPATAEITDCAIHLIKSLIISPSKRLSYEDVVMHPFFKDIDFSALRQVTPPYLPPVGELDDVSNFSGGGSRARDEAILDVSRNQTFSPIRYTKSSVQDGYVTQCATLNNEENEEDETVLVKPLDTEILNDENQENINPHKSPLSPEVLKRKAIQEAAAVPINEEIEEIEDIEWEGSECVRDLPFLGYTYTPGLVLFGNLSKKQVHSTAVAHVGTSVIANISTPYRRTFIENQDSLSTSLRHSIGCSDVGRLKDAKKTSDPEIVGLSELQQRNRQLCEQIEQLQLQNKESEDLRQRLLSAFDNGHVLKEINEAVRVLSDTVVEKEKSTVGHLNSRIKHLQEENVRLTASVQSCQQAQAIVDQLQHAVSRLSNLPSNFTEADLLDLLTGLCPPTVYTTPEMLADVSLSTIRTSNSSDNLIGYELVHRLINFALKQFKHASNRARQSCYALESTNAELKKALDESKQQVNQLVETIDGLIADQRRYRETESNLNWEIKELKQKLDDSKDYQRDLHQKFLQFEDKYFSARERLKEEEKKNKEITEKLEQLTLNSVQKQQNNSSELQTQSGQLSLLVERNKEVERELAALRNALQEATQQNGSELSELRKQLDNVRTEKEHLFNDKQSERRQLEERADKAETQLKSLRDQIAVMLTERGRLVSLSAIDSQRLSDMQLQLNDAIMKKESAEISLREATLRLERLNTTHNQTLILDQMRNEFESTRSQLRTAQTELIQYKQNEELLRERVANYEREISDLKQEVTLLRTRHDQLQASIALGHTAENSSEVHNQLVTLTNEKQTLQDEIDQLRTQVERLRLNNTQLLSQRDTARQDARESEMATVRAKELGEATQQALEREVHRLSTITEQQGKLINHMRGLLPPEFNNTHRNCSADGSSDYQNSEGGKRRASKFISSKSRRPGAPLISAASAFFNKHRKREVKTESNPENVEYLSSNEFTRQPSRIQKMMSKTRLNFKKHSTMPVKVDYSVNAPYYTTSANDECYMEDYDPLGYDVYSADDADFDDGLPFPAPSTFAVPHGRPPRASDNVSNTGSTSSAPSTASSAPAGPVKFVRDHSWHRNRSKIHVGWADGNDKPELSKVPSALKHRGQPKILKQLSKVLGRGKQSSTHLDPNRLDD